MERTLRTIPTAALPLVVLIAGLAVAMAPALAEDAPRKDSLEITLAHDSEAERTIRGELLALVEEHDVTPFLYTRKVVIDEETRIPHSHPVLTLNTRYQGDDLLATFLHEQFHWTEGEEEERVRAAMEEFREIYPEVPVGGGQGARNEDSTYLHLVVCDRELDALASLVGEDRARAQIAGNRHYQWIYDKVLHDERVREVNRRHGLMGEDEAETETGSR